MSEHTTLDAATAAAPVAPAVTPTDRARHYPPADQADLDAVRGSMLADLADLVDDDAAPTCRLYTDAELDELAAAPLWVLYSEHRDQLAAL